MGALTDSVGKNGANLKQDVMRVQRLLKTAGLDPGPDDGLCGNETIRAIKDFQSRFSANPNGLIEAEGPTWRKLAEVQQRSLGE
ncbi:peptidoglycan-binding protein [Geobacter sp. DSM 9736]|uniref:peptidoglycan-binding domain-containing protein n=1 Tax=Geobacter sp. DSM 9736 TaxID=1277350 RepID=UPI000B510104|nr:peptidoglycan-binding domain-containing protein [Geobacter sp. DSM 9736]SNB45328.1 Putative peptidoglycan binding domain-containing protein [Geobacter sp. DSM 9736]